MSFRFYIGLHHPSDGKHFDRACISIHTLGRRQKPVGAKLLVDSGAFTTIATHGGYPEPVSAYAAQLRNLIERRVAPIDAVVAQDFMCEPGMLKRTGLTVEDHQRLTIERYDALLAEHLETPVMPVLQGYAPADYIANITSYGDRLRRRSWVGVGSVCKRNGTPDAVLAVLWAIKSVRPDLRLHGFGLKLTALQHPGVRELLYSADSMAWSFSARRQGRNPNDWREAKAFERAVSMVALRQAAPWQMPLL